jgi:hypothetical protein
MKNPVILLLLIFFGFISTFLTGFYLHSYLAPAGEDLSPQGSSIPEATGSAGISTQFLPGKHYFDDTIIMISKDIPHYTIAASIGRSETNNGYTETTRLSYFDGQNWVRKVDSQVTKDSGMEKNALLKQWSIAYDPSRVLKQSVNAEFTLDSTKIAIDTNTLENEIGMRSLPGYTKFMSRSDGILTINGTDLAAYVLYTRIYSLNAADIQFYDAPLGVTTDWIALWDTDGNFYHIDKTSVQKPTPLYQTHEIAVYENAQHSVTKSFSVKASRDSENAPKLFTMNIHDPINTTLSLTLKNQFNKYPGLPYTWFMGHADGEIRTSDGSTRKGFGLIEYIHD